MNVKFKGSSIGEEAMFWEARCLQKLGENDAAANIYREIIDSKTYTYYTFASQRSLKSIGVEYDIPKIDNTVYPGNPKIATLLPEIYQDIENINASGSSQDGKFTHIDKAKELLSLEFYLSASKEIEAGSGEFEQDNLRILEISTLYLKAKDYLNSQKLIAKYFSKLKSNLNNPYKDYVYFLLYPYGFKEYIDKYSAQFNVDPLFVLAVIREESRFQPDAGSYAGALGLMQIIPKTGKGIASQLGIPKFSNQMLLDPEMSIRMGSYYLSKQLESFNQNKYYACGAYNGGPGSMSKWISSWGDKDIDEFIEYVSYDETRNYIKKVMGSYYFYQMLYP
jgi:soluble lytic murein transglycosylase